MIKPQVFIAKGNSPWFNPMWWADKKHVTNTDESTLNQATVVCDGNVIDTVYMFYGCHKLTTLNLSGFNTSKVINMSYMFYNCHGLTSLDLSSFDTSNVISMEHMFYDCTGLTTLDISNFDTSNVTKMWKMFYGCSNLTTIKGTIDMKSCKWYRDMFTNCPKLKGIKIKNPPTDFNESWAGLSSSQYIVVPNHHEGGATDEIGIVIDYFNYKNDKEKEYEVLLER